MATGVTFANAQSNDSAKTAVKMEETTKAEVATKAEAVADTAVLAPVSELKAAPVEAEKAELRKDAPMDKQKARAEKKASQKVE